MRQTTGRIWKGVLAVVWCTSVLRVAQAGDIPATADPTTTPSATMPTDAQVVPSPAVVLAQAIEAHGGMGGLAKAAVGRVVIHITGEYQPKLSGEFDLVDTFDLPGHLRRQVDGKGGGKAFHLLYVCNGDRSWAVAESINGAPVVTEFPLREPVSNIFPYALLSGIGLLRDGKVQLSVKRSFSWDHRPAFVVRVETNGQWFADNVFDAQTHLLISSIKSLPDINNKGEPVKSETHYTDYKSIQDINVPMTVEMFKQGKPYLTMKVTQVEFVDRLDAHLFDKPLVEKPEAKKATDSDTSEK